MSSDFHIDPSFLHDGLHLYVPWGSSHVQVRRLNKIMKGVITIKMSFFCAWASSQASKMCLFKIPTHWTYIVDIRKASARKTIFIQFKVCVALQQINTFCTVWHIFLFPWQQFFEIFKTYIAGKIVISNDTFLHIFHFEFSFWYLNWLWSIFSSSLNIGVKCLHFELQQCLCSICTY